MLLFGPHHCCDVIFYLFIHQLTFCSSIAAFVAKLEYIIYILFESYQTVSLSIL